jgi:hypothetical protein
MRDFNDQARPPPIAARDHQKELLKLITGMAGRHGAWQVFADFVEMGAISISNAVDLTQRETRETRYLEIVKRYRADEIAKFPQMLAELVMALEDEPSDVLGRTFHDLELHNKYAGQYFSPYTLCRMMAKMTVGDGVEDKITERGFVTAMEPAAGSGAMIIAIAHEMKDAGINYQQHLHATAVDVDPKCVHMAYLQLSLLHIPAVIIHGNSLTLEEIGHWYTPAHIIDGWKWKLRRNAEASSQHGIERPSAPVASQVPDTPREEPPFAPSQLTLF